MDTRFKLNTQQVHFLTRYQRLNAYQNVILIIYFSYKNNFSSHYEIIASMGVIIIICVIE